MHMALEYVSVFRNANGDSVVMVQDCSPRAWKLEAGAASSRLAWATYQDPVSKKAVDKCLKDTRY